MAWFHPDFTIKVVSFLGQDVFTKSKSISITPDFSAYFINNLLWGDAFNEKIIVTLIETIGNEFLSDKFRWLGNEFWIEKEVNLWELKDFVDEERRRELEIFMHPMQPDIDILFGPKVNNERLTPLTAVEVKLFKGIERGRVTPRAGGGFYEGIGEAIALLTFGVDFVELWQFFFLPIGIEIDIEIPPHLPPERKKEIKEWFKERKREEKKMKRYIDYICTYADFVGNLIKVLKLPLGYRCFAISMDMETILLSERESSYILPKENPFLVSEDASIVSEAAALIVSGAVLKMRSLIKEALNVKEGNEGR